MATYDWIGGATGDWGDQNNWENVDTLMFGVPGAGDTAEVSNATVTVNGVTVANLGGDSLTEIVGDITVTGELYVGTLSGGTVNAGTVGTEDVTTAFQGVSLTAKAIDNGNRTPEQLRPTCLSRAMSRGLQSPRRASSAIRAANIRVIAT
jgi:hypothetical protein